MNPFSPKPNTERRKAIFSNAKNKSRSGIFDFAPGQIAGDHNLAVFVRKITKRPTNMMLAQATALVFKKESDVFSEMSRSEGSDNVHEEVALEFDNYFKEEDDQTTFNKMNKWVVKVDGKFKTAWDNLQLVFILYIAVFLPLKFSFYSTDTFFIWDAIDNLVDIYFAFDLILIFFTPYYSKGKLVTNHLFIALNYFKFWFWIDFLSIFPFDFVMSNYSTSYSKALRLAKLPKLYKMLKIAKLLRTLKLRKKGDSILGRVFGWLSGQESIGISILPYYIFGLVSTHIFACLWHFLSLNDENVDSWLFRYHYDSEAPIDRFVASLYYVYTTVSTTGYGDIVPGTSTEYLVTLIFMGAGVSFHSLIYTRIMIKLNEFRERREFFQEKRNLLKRLKKKTTLFNNAEVLYSRMIRVIKVHEQNNIEKVVIPSFKNIRHIDREILFLELCEKEYGFEDITFFQKLPKLLWLRFFERMEKRTYSPGDQIYEVGNPSLYFFVIRSGEVFFIVNERDTKMPFMKVDTFFGEIEFFANYSSRRWTVFAKTKCVFYTIKKRDFNYVFEDVKWYQAFAEASKDRLKYFNRAETACVHLLELRAEVIEEINAQKEKFQNKLRHSIWVVKGKENMRKRKEKYSGKIHNHHSKISKFHSKMEKIKARSRQEFLHNVAQDEFTFKEYEIRKLEITELSTKKTKKNKELPLDDISISFDE